MRAPSALDGSGGGQRVDVVFPVMHGTFGEEERFRGFWTWRDCRLFGAGVLGSAIGMDKDVAKKFCRWRRFRWCPGLRCIARIGKSGRKNCKRLMKKFNIRCCETGDFGSSVGMTKAHSRANWGQRWIWLLNCAEDLVEKAVSAREIEVSVLGNSDRRLQFQEKLCHPGNFMIMRQVFGRRDAAVDSGN